MKKRQLFGMLITCVIGVFITNTVFAQTPPGDDLLLVITEEEKPQLIEIYLKKNPDKIKSDIDFIIESALGDDSYSQWRVGSLYGNLGNHFKARAWFSQSADQGHFFGIDSYARNRMEGIGGHIDFIGGVSDIVSLGNYPSNMATTVFLETLESIDYVYQFSTEITRIYWLEFYANRGLNSFLFDESVDTSVDLYNKVAHIYENRADASKDYYVYGENLENDKKLLIAKNYYKKANNIEEVSRINSLIEKDKKIQKSLSQELLNSCKNIFNHRFADAKEYALLQEKIFANPANAKEISNQYEESQKLRYEADNGEPFSFDFWRVSISSLLQIYFYAIFDVSDLEGIHVDDSLKDIEVTVKTRNRVPSLFINLLLEKYNINVVCTNNGIEINVPNDRSVAMQLVPSHLITHWEGEVEVRDGGLFGNGKIIFDSGLSFEGNIENSLPHGSGAYLEKDKIIIQSDEFFYGVPTGVGKLFENESLMFNGEFKDGAFNGDGEAFILDERYKGHYKDGEHHGKGFLSKVRHDPSELQRYFYPLNFKAPAISSFNGSFVNGKKHGEGICRVYGKDNQEEAFPCQFYQDNLIEVEGVSLLPPGSVLSTHFDNLSYATE